MTKLQTLKQTLRRMGMLWMIVLLAGLYHFSGGAIEASAQAVGTPSEDIRQLPAPLPKLALKGANGLSLGGTHYHRIALTITNWQNFSAAMFIVPVGRKLPPNPCSSVKSRVILTVYSERGALLAGCIPMPKADDLGQFSILIQKGKSVPDFVYAVLHDRHTGAAYRSNLVSPWNGLTK